MFKTTTTDKQTEQVSSGSLPPPIPLKRKQSGVFRLLGLSSVVMSVLLPIGIVPRLMQSQELAQVHQHIESDLPSVQVTSPKVAPAERAINLPGTIEGLVQTTIYARSNGYVTHRYVDIGDKVAAGQLLAHIDTPEVDQSAQEAAAQVLVQVAGKSQNEANREQAQAELDKAIAEVSQAKAQLVEKESDLRFAQSTYERWKLLGSEGAISQQDVDDKENRLKVGQASKSAAQDRVRAAESQVAAALARLLAQQATINLSTANISAARARAVRTSAEKSFQNIVSPFDGVITERNVDTGALVTAGSDSSRSALYKLARIDTLKVFVDVPQYAAMGVKSGQKVDISLKEFPNRKFNGTVARTSVALDPVARTLRTEIHIANKDLALAPGLYADVTFSVPRHDAPYVVPVNAVVLKSGKQQVAAVKNGKIEFLPVKLGNDLGAEVEIVDGLTGTEKLVLNPPVGFANGTMVSVSDGSH